MKVSLPKEAYWTTELIYYYVEKRYPGLYNFYYLIQEQDDDPRFNKHLKSRVHLVNISFQQTIDIYDSNRQTICLLKISGSEHVHSVVGYFDIKSGERDLGQVLSSLDRQHSVSFFPGKIADNKQRSV